jgi:branched-chain amino acid transport system ATP-binding protein
MADALLEVRQLRKAFGGLQATDGVDIDVRDGETHAVIGPNGAGKTTLISQLSGMLRPDSGQIRFAGEDITRLPAPARAQKGLARSFQITSIYREFSAPTTSRSRAGARRAQLPAPASGAQGRRAAPRRADARRGRAGARADVIAANLAHGEQRQLIAMALATSPRLLLLTSRSRMGTEESQRMVQFLGTERAPHDGPLEHDMDAVFLACRLDLGARLRPHIANGAPQEIRANPEARAAYLGEDT